MLSGCTSKRAVMCICALCICELTTRTIFFAAVRLRNQQQQVRHQRQASELLAHKSLMLLRLLSLGLTVLNAMLLLGLLWPAL